MRLQDIPEDIEPQVGDIIEIEQDDVCFEVRIIGITADGYLCEQDNVEGAVLLEGVALDHGDVADITGYIAEEKVRLDPKCWKGKKIGNPKTKIKGGVRVNNCVPEGQEDIEESGLQYYTGVKKHGAEYMKRAAKAGREGASQEELGRLRDRYSKAEKTKESVEQEVAESTEQSLQKKIQAKRDALGLAREQRRARGQHQQGQREIKLQAEIDELSNQLTQMKKQDVAEAGPFSYGYKKPRKGSVAYWADKKRKEQEKGKPPIEPKDQMVGVAKVTKGVAEGSTDLVQIEYWQQETIESGRWVKTKPMPRATAEKIVNSFERGEIVDVEQGVAEGYTGRETKDGTWRVFKDGQAVAVAGPFKSRDEAHAWIKKHKQGVSEGWGFDQWGHDTWTDAQKEVARKKKYEMMMRNGQVKKFVAKNDADAKRIAAGHGAKSVIRLRGGVPAGKVAEQGVSEAKSLKKRVRVVQGEHAGKTGWIREIKHGIHSTAPKRYYVDIDGGGQANNLPASALRLLKNQSDSQKGMAEGGHDDQFSLSGRMPATDRIPQDSTQHQDRQLAMVDKIKQQTIAYILNLRPEFERSDLELATTPELIQMLRDIQSGKMTEAEYQGRKVPLGKPMAGDVKKSKVYVRKPNGKVVKVNFGDKNMKIKKSNPKRRKSFRARHNCENPGPRWKARYWSCRAW